MQDFGTLTQILPVCAPSFFVIQKLNEQCEERHPKSVSFQIKAWPTSCHKGILVYERQIWKLTQK